MSGNYGDWEVAPEHHGEEIWIVAGPPQVCLFRDRLGTISRGSVYRRADGMVARAEYVELLCEFKRTGASPDSSPPGIASSD